MRWLKLTLSSLTLALIICAPALAQSSPTASQYDPLGPSSCDAATEICAQSVDDSVQDIADDAEQGTAAVNGAMNDAVAGPAASTSESGTSVPAASAPPEAVLSSETAASPGSVTSPATSSGAGVTEGGATTGGGESPSSITVLPETGGASPVLLGLGVLLVASSLLTRGVIKR